MSETLSMPISWLCLCLTSEFCSPMSPSPKCRTFFFSKYTATHYQVTRSDFDFDLTCDVTRAPELNKICFPSTVFPGLSNAA